MVTPETMAAAGRVAQRGARIAMKVARAVNAGDTTPSESLRDGAEGAEGADERPKSAIRQQDDPVRDPATP